MEINYVSIGNRIREIRLQKRWTQALLAERAGVEPSNISHIERAATKVSLPTLVAIANALEVTLDDLVYQSLIKSEGVSLGIVGELLSDCSASEIAALAEVIKTTKAILRTQHETVF